MKNKKMKVIGIVVVASIVMVIMGARQIMPGKITENKNTNVNLHVDFQKHNESGKSKLRKEADRIYQKNKELLILVNKINELPSSYIRNLTEICDGRLEVDERLVKDLRKMLKAARNKGHRYFIASAYRSRERQKYLVEKNIADLMAKGMEEKKAKRETYRQQQMPGHSEHETGLALDILCAENLVMENRAQAKLRANQWLRKNCYKYGFVLRYPKKKEDVTLIAYESWHFRYVGKEAARFMHENKLTLEEFYGYLE